MLTYTQKLNTRGWFFGIAFDSLQAAGRKQAPVGRKTGGGFRLSGLYTSLLMILAVLLPGRVTTGGKRLYVQPGDMAHAQVCLARGRGDYR